MGKKMKSDDKFVVAHRQLKDGKHLVAAQLRVLVCPADNGGFVAQGLEIDYCSTGATVEDVQERFATGFLMTVEALIKRNRPLSALFKSKTPPEIWQEYVDTAKEDQLICGTVVDLSAQLPTSAPFQSLAFCSPRQMSLA